jgi:hypothetical protein
LRAALPRATRSATDRCGTAALRFAVPAAALLLFAAGVPFFRLGLLVVAIAFAFLSVRCRCS